MAETIWSPTIVDLAGRSLLEVNCYRNKLVRLFWNLRYWWDSLAPVNLARSRVTRYSAPCIDVVPEGYPTRRQLIAELGDAIVDEGRPALAKRIDQRRRTLLRESELLCSRIEQWQGWAAVTGNGEFPNGIPETLNIEHQIASCLAIASELVDTVAPLAGRPVDFGMTALPNTNPIADVDAYCTDEFERNLCHQWDERAIGFARTAWYERQRSAEQEAKDSIRQGGITNERRDDSRSKDVESEFQRLRLACLTAIEAMFFLRHHFGNFNTGDRYAGRTEVDVLNDFNQFFYEGDGPWADKVRSEFRSLSAEQAFRWKSEPAFVELLVGHMTQKFDRSALVALGKVNAVMEGLAEPSVQDRYPNGVAIGCTSVCEFVFKEMEKVRRQFESAVRDWYRRRREPRPHGIKQCDIGVDAFGSGAETPVFDLVDRITTDIGREIALAASKFNFTASDTAAAQPDDTGRGRKERKRGAAESKLVNARMLELIEADYELIWKPAEWFANELGCNASTVKSKDAWKTVIMAARNEHKNEAKDRLRERGRATSPEDF